MKKNKPSSKDSSENSKGNDQQIVTGKLKKFVRWNKWTFRAFKCKTEEDFRRLCLQCFNEIAAESNKNWKDVSLEDLYRVLHKIRQKSPKMLRNMTLKQALNLKDGISKSSDLFNIIYGLIALQPSLLVLFGLKKAFGKRAEYGFKISLVQLIADEIYKGGDKDS